ncbi:MAG: DUF4278 domain-containing protein [Leptolyngbyaceae cyanobacterium bins.349]|nr:DUF4278 domain-containing protein [Leptolyngbyaceae cyanobacterium bins.349]
MSIFQFIWQTLAISGLIVALLVGLFAAPWYVLGGVLLVALVLTWRLMPSRETWVAETTEPFPDQSNLPTSAPHHPSSASHSPDLLYRGAHYTSTGASWLGVPAQPATLSYRGAHYATEPQTPGPLVEPSHPQGQSCDQKMMPLKYRGAKVQPQSSHPQARPHP